MARYLAASVRLAVLLLVFAAATAGAATGSFPAKPIRLISPFAPGGSNGTMSRVLAQAMTRNTGQTVIVDNRPGANTITHIRAEMVKWAKVIKATGMKAD